MKKLLSLSVLALSALLLVANCGERGVQPTQINGSGSAGDGQVSLRLPIPKALAQRVARVEAVVSANDMETITQDLTIDENGDAKGIIRNVPAGLARIVALNAYDAGGTLIYTGSSRVDVVTGGVNNDHRTLSKPSHLLHRSRSHVGNPVPFRGSGGCQSGTRSRDPSPSRGTE